MDIARGPYDFYFKCKETLRFTYDFTTISLRFLLRTLKKGRARNRTMYEDRGKCNLLGMTPCGLPTIAIPKLSCKNRAVIARLSQSLTTAPVQCPTTCLRATVLRFLKICKSADYYKIEEAKDIVGSRRIVGTS